jgi:adenylate cyclase
VDQGWLLALALGAFVLVACAWLAVEVVRRMRRRRRRERPGLDALAGLVPLAAQPLTSLVGWLEKSLSRLQPMTGPDGTVTLLFSDIVDSTTLNHRLGDDAWVRVLVAHDRIVRSVVGDHGGVVVKTQGDGFMAAFRTPREAVDAALAIAPALNASDDIGVKLELRMGIHTGAVVRHGSDYHGTNVVLAARLAQQARPGEVLVSGEVFERLQGRDGLRFHARRRTRVKGIPGRHRFHEVVAH